MLAHPLTDREIEIVQGLLVKVLVHEEVISRVCDVCAELDCLLCFAEASSAFNYVRPQITQDNIIDIRQGRYITDYMYSPFTFIHFLQASTSRTTCGYFHSE